MRKNVSNATHLFENTARRSVCFEMRCIFYTCAHAFNMPRLKCKQNQLLIKRRQWQQWRQNAQKRRNENEELKTAREKKWKLESSYS